MEDKNYIFAQYQHISNKLKKRRILKKPNVAEASQQYESLAATCEAEDLPQYAGLCYQAAANCQSSLGNVSEQAHFLLKASRQFMLSYTRLIDRHMVQTDENLHEALVCYKSCMETYESIQDSSVPDVNVILAGISMEMADTLKTKLGDAEQAFNEYKKSLKYLDKSPVEKIHCLRRLVSCKIELGDYHDALGYTNSVVEETQRIGGESGVKEDALRYSEITRILLLLILQPTPQQISPVAASILEKYAWVETSDNNEIADLQTTLKNKGISVVEENLFLCLQSLVMACQYDDRESLVVLENELIPYLSLEQRDLVRILVRKKLR